MFSLLLYGLSALWFACVFFLVGRELFKYKTVAISPDKNRGSLKKKKRDTLQGKLAKKRDTILALFGLSLAFGSWGYSVLSPEPQIWLGELLLFGAFACFAVLLIHLFDFKLKGCILVVIIVGTVFWIYMHKIVIAPLGKRELLAALQDGYDLRDECASRPYYDEAPRYIGDSEERWMSRVQTILKHAGKVDDLQMWEQAELVGLVKDGNLIGFRCTRMAIKTEALETIIGRHYDRSIKGNPYVGPVYVLDLQHGGGWPTSHRENTPRVPHFSLVLGEVGF